VSKTHDELQAARGPQRKVEEAALQRFDASPGHMVDCVLMTRRMDPLVAIKVLHTAVWALLTACILALPITPILHRFDWAIILTVIVLAECGVLALNRGRCPLTGLAARFTNNRVDNSDIYLPNWVARHNKAIFGTLFVINELIVLWCRLK
jgi:hypothetical protein